MMHPRKVLLAVVAAVSMLAAACGSESTVGSAPADAPVVVASTNILGDVVANIVGDQMNVVTIMPVGADPHDFQASAQQVAQISEAEVMVVNGASFEEGLLDVIESAESDGIPVHEAITGVSTIEFGEGGHDDHGHGDEHDDHGDEYKDEDEHDHDEHGDEEHADEDEHDHDEHADEDEHDHDEHGDEEHGDEEHADEEHADEDDHDHDEHGDEHDDHGDEHDDHGHDDHSGHDHSGEDPHFFTDPARMAIAADGIADFLIANVDGIDADSLRSSADAYIEQLNELDAEVEETLSGLTEEQRVLITNHEVFGYFADNYDFEVVGTVIPSGSTLDGTSAQALAELTELIQDEGVAAIFSDTSSSDELIDTLAAEVGDISVVELFTESLGEDGSGGATYIEMVQTNAERIAEALAA